ncbi:TonB-dependent receptor [Paracidobacterium acidisoli]|nr:TonB-dependent receptor [Paracidobacterium acidisoli]MBT9329708.1 TonB-dependent receptor [Paracidobacterium acidisoli]
MRFFALLLFCLICVPMIRASVFGQIQGIVHDPHHRPVPGVHVSVHAAHSDLSFSAITNQDGAFRIPAVPLGDYVVTVSSEGFATLQQTITVTSDSTLILHFPLEIATVAQSTTITAEHPALNPDTVTPTTQISRMDIAETPGAGRTNSLAMITDYVPGAYMTHDMLHMRGGHQLSWLIDGVSIPNTNIASNIAPQIDPGDIDTLEVDRGSYNAGLGDRTYGIFNVVPRTGFEYNREGEFVTSIGSYYQTNNQLSLGSHSEKFAWFTSLNGNRSNYGLQPAIEQPVHDAENGYGGFGSLIYNVNTANQMRLVSQLRTDYYQIPRDPDPDDWQNQLYPSSGLRDGEHETDGYVAFTWVHTFNPTTLLQVSPFYHYNSAKYEPHSDDFPTATTADQTGNYAGLQAAISTSIAKNALSGGVYSYEQHEGDLFSIQGQLSPQNSNVNGGIEELWLEDSYKPAPWLTLTGGERQTHFQGTISEDAIYPRIGAAVQIPKLHWVFRGFYGHFYQPPPLTTISGPLLQLAQDNNTSFQPLRGERDEEHQFGVQIPFRGWLLDADTFQTRANNFLDHSNIGASSIYIPVTVDGALIQGWELTLRSPQLWKYGRAHLAYSNQIAQQRGPISGGLICYSPGDPSACAVPPGYSPLDHDQRNTLNVGLDGNLPDHIYGSFNIYYGSGFSNGYTDPPSPYSGDYLPAHTTADAAMGKTFSDKVTLSINALNIANTRVLLDNSLTFGGFHYNDPRQIYGEVRYRFHF